MAFTATTTTTNLIDAATTPTLAKRIGLPPFNSSTAPPGLIEAVTKDPWFQADQYSRGWLYFCIILLVAAALLHVYHAFSDRVRAAAHKQANHDQRQSVMLSSPDTPYEMNDLRSSSIHSATSVSSTRHLIFSPAGSATLSATEHRTENTVAGLRVVNVAIAMFRWLFYRPLPSFTLHRKLRPIALPSLSVLLISFAALAFTACYCFVPQPLYWQRISFGSPPVAIRSGMIAVAMIPWLVALSMKANLVSLLTGIGHERLNVLHRWGGWLCLFLSLVHTIPFYVQPIWDRGGYQVFKTFFNTGIYIYGTGFAALIPLCFLCLHSLPVFRNWMYELFLAIHVPAAIVFLAMTFWHCNNYLTSWNYLFATVAIWVICLLYRLFHLNWILPWRSSWLIGDEASVYVMEEDAIKVTIPTQMRWKPGQYVYLRMPGISVFENHPFTIASLCSDDLPSDYGPEYRDMVLVFRPFGGFTNRVLRSAIKNGPWHNYRAFLDGPYGGVARALDSFDTVVLIAGGSGITAVVSHLLHLIKRMRDGKAATKHVHVFWALKRPETMEWFKEELRICRDFAPPDTVTCQFFITAAKRHPATGQLVSAQTPSRPAHGFPGRVDAAFASIAQNRLSRISEAPSRQSQLIADEAADDPEKAAALHAEKDDTVSALPQAALVPVSKSTAGVAIAEGPIHMPSKAAHAKRGPAMTLDIAAATAPPSTHAHSRHPSFVHSGPAQFDFGFSSASASTPTPSEVQHSLMRFAFQPAGRKRDSWTVEYGRPDMQRLLQRASGAFGRRAAVFVCGPPSMRGDVQAAVARVQGRIVADGARDEVFLHTENYSI